LTRASAERSYRAMAAAGSFWVPFVVGGVAAASVLAWQLDARRASRSLRAMSAMAVLVMTASVTVWTGVATLLHRTPAESVLVQTARVVRRVRQLTPREEASLPARTSPDATRGIGIPAECAPAPVPDEGEGSRQWGGSPHFHRGASRGRVLCPFVAFSTAHESEGGDTYSRGHSNVENTELGWGCGSWSSHQRNAPPPFGRPISVQRQLALRRSADGRVVEYTCRLTECTPPDQRECAPGVGSESIPALYLVQRDEQRRLIRHHHPPLQRSEATRLAVTTAALWTFVLLLLRRSAAPPHVTRGPEPPPLAPYRSVQPIAPDQPQPPNGDHTSTVLAALALSAIVLFGTVLALAS